ncbi:MAG: 2-amino-4-hydroxy-6-hydroxymethyldihydropteridine diphosphokinase [Saprospiraceae bacterium]|nr:2-amino-4-hydroxy-6-hydroxymethyldihydropteridine diphosphokinase [Saprospiraceae bacterium]MBK7811511.1 2-amino-4-hydroxy-6-hydroxymethyldihydropteridine diphosphokinase [Saprospiraceae bacterium]
MQNKKRTAFFLLGSNMGDRKAWIGKAIQLMEERIAKIKKKSALYETAAWGDTSQKKFLNIAVSIESSKPPHKLLQLSLEIEEELGRIRTVKNAARRIDIDLLLCGDEQIEETDLQIPHPRLHLRNFALIPLMEIAGEVQHPTLHKSIEELFFECEDRLEVIKLNEK